MLKHVKRAPADICALELNIIKSPFEYKYRMIHPKNSLMNNKMLSIDNMERLI
jgi:hypothetical protein